jgi:dipeptidase E
MPRDVTFAREPSHTARLLLFSNSTQHGRAYLDHAAAPIRDFLGESVRTVVFIPYALLDHDGYERKAREVFKALGYELASLHASPSPSHVASTAQAFFVGGGNTFRLLRALQDQALLASIVERVRAGTPYIGASAGSNIACRTIKTTNDMPIVEPRDFHALDLLPFQINPHYLDPDPASTHEGETREKRIAEFHEENADPVLGIREGTWLCRERDSLTFHGPAGARLFRKGERPQEIPDGADLSNLLAIN